MIVFSGSHALELSGQRRQLKGHLVGPELLVRNEPAI